MLIIDMIKRIESQSSRTYWDFFNADYYIFEMRHFFIIDFKVIIQQLGPNRLYLWDSNN